MSDRGMPSPAEEQQSIKEQDELATRIFDASLSWLDLPETDE